MKKIFYLLVITFFIVFSSLLIADSNWNTFQYPQEAKNYILSARMSGDRLFLGTNGNSLFYTDDGGANWTKFDYDNFRYVGIYDILFGPAGEIYCITNNQIYKTSDVGKNWEYFNYFSDNAELIKSAFINPQGTIVVGTDKGVYISDSSLGGTQWTKIETGHKDFISDKVVIDPFNNIIVGGWGDGVYKILWADLISDSFTEAQEGIGCTIDSARFATDQSGNIFLSLKKFIYQFNSANRNWTEIGQTEEDNDAKQIRLSPTGLIALFNPNNIYLYEPKTRVMVRNPGINDSTPKYIVDVLIRPGGQIIVMDPEEANESVMAGEVLIQMYYPDRFRVTDARGTTIKNATFGFYIGDCDNNYTLIKGVTTDNEGIFTLAANYYGLHPGDKFKLSGTFWKYDAPKSNHHDVENKISNMELNNMKFDDRGVPTYQTFTTDTLQEIVMDHQLIGLYLTVSVEWDATREYLDSMEYAIRVASRDLFDITDGQLYIKKIAVYDNRRYWDQCDMRVHATTEGIPCASVGGAHRSESDKIIKTPRMWWADTTPTNLNGHEYNWFRIPYWTTYGETFAHELGHYWFGFRDEYVWTNSSIARPSVNFGFMDDQYLWTGNHRGSEMSTAEQYTNPNSRYTAQWRTNSTDCWTFFKQRNERDRAIGTTSNVLYKIFKPSERTLASGYNYLIGPVDIMTNQAGCDVTSAMTVYLYDDNIGAGYVYLHLATNTGASVQGATVTLQRNSTPGAAPIIQGKTNRNGNVCVLGAKVGDRILFDGATCPNRTYRNCSATYNVTSIESANKKGDVPLSTINIELLPLNGDYKFVNTWLYDLDGNLNVTLFSNREMIQQPMAEIITEQSTKNYNFDFNGKASAYYANIPESSLSTDVMMYSMFDDNTTEFYSSIYYNIFKMSDDLIVSDGKTEIILDTLTQKMSKISVMSSNMIPLLNGLPDSTENIGPVVSITAYPEELSSQDNTLRINYGGDKLEFGDETTLSLYRWDDVNLIWDKVTSSVDTAYNYVIGNISSSGTYAIFTTGGETGVNDFEFFDSFGLKAEPNPATGKTLISFNMPDYANANLELYNMLGVKIKTISSERMREGRNEFELDFSGMTDGCYFIKLTSNGRSEITSLIVVK